MFSATIAVVAPVFLISGIGYAWARLDQPFDTRMVAALGTTVGTPCLVLDTMTRIRLEPDTLLQMVGAATLGIGAMALAGVILLRAARLPLQAYLPATMFGNHGNMGLPLCLFAFGDHGLALAIAFFVVAATLNFTVGVAIASGRFSPLAMLRAPVVWALALALVLTATDRALPEALARTVELLGGMVIPLMLLALGVALARLNPGGLLRAAVLSAARLALGWSVGLAVVWAMDLSGPVRGVVLIEMAMPVAVFNYLFAQRYDNRPEDVAGLVLMSTVMAFALLPVLLWLAWDGAPPPV